MLRFVHDALLRLSLPREVPHGIEVFALPAPDECLFAIDTFAALSPDEQRRHARYRKREDALRYANTRLVLRALLAERMHCATEDIRLQYGPHGKPLLSSENTWHFNVSHSREISLLVLSRRCPVGIDIEALDAGLPLAEIAQQAFAASERRHVETGGVSAFYAIWTAKEAAFKAWGCGLGTDSLRKLCLLPGVSAEMHLSFEGELPQPLRVWQLPMPAGHAAALAVS
jgi:4'-phosphopantetheinyl transferase